MDEQTRKDRTLEALEKVAEKLEKLRMLREHEMGVRVENDGGSLWVRAVEEAWGRRANRNNRGSHRTGAPRSPPGPP